MSKFGNKASRRQFLIETVLLIFLMTVFSFGIWAQVAESGEPPISPSITHVAPQSGEQDSTIDVIIEGFNFDKGTKVKLYPSEGIMIVSVEFLSDRKLKATLAIAKDAPLGLRHVTVTNPDMMFFILRDAFKVVKPAPPPPPKPEPPKPEPPPPTEPLPPKPEPTEPLPPKPEPLLEKLAVSPMIYIILLAIAGASLLCCCYWLLCKK